MVEVEATVVIVAFVAGFLLGVLWDRYAEPALATRIVRWARHGC